MMQTTSIDFSTLRAVVTDMDGVLWRGDEALPGLVELFTFLEARKVPVVLATNNSRRAPVDYIAKLAKMGVAGILPQQIITSGTATIDYLQQQYPPGTPVYIIGGQGLHDLAHQSGFIVSEEAVRAVIVGIDVELTYAKLRRACLLIRQGAQFIGTNGDVTFPDPDGLVPGAGSILALLQAATDVQPVVIGKPEPAMFQTALRLLNTPASSTLMIGDRINTDILGAKQCGLQTALVLTGVSDGEEMGQDVSQPDGVFSGLPALIEAWKSAL